MKRTLRLPFFALLAGAASAFACTFGANDFKIVPASAGSSSTNGGDANNAGSSAIAGMSSGGAGPAAGTSAGGTDSGEAGAETGGTGGSGMSGSGGVGGSGGATGLKCTNHTPKPLTAMAYADLHSVDSVDRLVLAPVPGGDDVFAIAVVQTNPSSMSQTTHIVVRDISDSNNGVVRNIGEYAVPNYFQFGGAWATATALNFFGQDSADGFVLVTLPFSNGNLDFVNIVKQPYDTPMDCQNSVRNISISVDPTGQKLSFVASCQPNGNDQNAISLWLYTPVLGATRNIAMATGTATNPDVNNIVRGFVRNGPVNATNNLILVGNDNGAPPTFYRAGDSPMLLGTLNQLALSSDATLLQQFLAVGEPGMSGGAFLMAGQFHDPMTPVTGPLPVTIWAGQVTPDAYATFGAAVPPTQMTAVATYNDETQVFFPADAYIQGSTAIVAAEDALIQQNIELWELPVSGGSLQLNFPVYGNANEALSNPRIAPIGSIANTSIIAWVDNTSAGTEVLASSIGCF
jgi:hypothetical protein